MNKDPDSRPAELSDFFTSLADEEPPMMTFDDIAAVFASCAAPKKKK
jgi:hypothetical protein